MIPFAKRFKGVVPILGTVFVGLLLPQSSLPDTVFAKDTQISVFRGTPVEAFMGGGSARNKGKAAQPAAKVWSKPARSSTQGQPDDKAAKPAAVQPEPVPVPVKPDLVPVKPDLVPVKPDLVPVKPDLVPVKPDLVPVKPVPVPVKPQAETAPAPLPAEPHSLQPEPKAVEKTDNDKPPQTTPAKEEKPEVRPESSDSCPMSKSKPGPNSAELLKQASELEKKGEYTPALSVLQSAFERASSSGDQKNAAAALHAHARVLHQLKREADALEYVNRSIALNKTLKDARARSQDLILAGKILMATSAFPAALKSFDEAQKILPESEARRRPELLENMASCLLKLDKHVEALATLNRGLAFCLKAANQTEAGRIHLLMGEISLSRSDYAAARANFKKALKLYKDRGSEKRRGRDAPANRISGPAPREPQSEPQRD